MRFAVGADIGKALDHTAVAIVDCPGTAELHLRHVERVRLGTSYPAIVGHLGGLMRRPELAGDADLVVDATGVGAAVVDGLEAEGFAPIAVTITGGRSTRRHQGAWRVPKFILVTALLAAFETGRLKIAPGLSYVPVLLRELTAFRRAGTARGAVTYGGQGEHDDLVLAVALATWWATIGARLARQGTYAETSFFPAQD